jgi:hypothetical protein
MHPITNRITAGATPTAGTTIGTRPLGTTTTGTMMMGRIMMNGNMMNGGMTNGNMMGGMMNGRMTNGNMMNGNTMNPNMRSPFNFPNGFGGFGNQGFGFSGNGFPGYGLGGYGLGGYGGGYGSGGYGLGGFDPNSYVPADDSQRNKSRSRRRSNQDESTPTLTPEQERERIHQQELAWSRSELPDTQTTSATALNLLLEDLQKLQTLGIQGPKVQIDQAILPSINVVTGGSNGNIGVLKHPHPTLPQGRGRVGWGISWPATLSGPEFETERQRIDSSIPKIIDEAINAEAVDLQDLAGALASMRGRLAAKITEVPASEYIRAKRILNDLNDAVRLLRQADAGNYFNQTYVAKGQTVAQLVQYMTRNNLRFAPAVVGDEAAYLVLHRALAEYDLAANSRVVAKK